LVVPRLTNACLVVYSKGKSGKGGNDMEAYCVKCRAKREMKDAKAITMKNGKPATQGVCPSCGTKIFRIGKA
jgi:hypothetical protein